jgi:hypothetical protein
MCHFSSCVMQCGSRLRQVFFYLKQKMNNYYNYYVLAPPSIQNNFSSFLFLWCVVVVLQSKLRPFFFFSQLLMDEADDKVTSFSTSSNGMARRWQRISSPVGPMRLQFVAVVSNDVCVLLPNPFSFHFLNLILFFYKMNSVAK